MILISPDFYMEEMAGRQGDSKKDWQSQAMKSQLPKLGNLFTILWIKRKMSIFAQNPI